ncbi:MAG: hypothetical protein ACD_46C00004G0010 [uncultured bacterium]|nr:MAG: hypothetical protein ACD_46C00004G0010 [uncultured bacterium]
MNNRMEIRPKRFINVCHYQHPSSKKTAFLIHGLGGRSGQWLPQLTVLKKDYSVVIPDLYGHGQSDKPKPSNAFNPYTFSEYEQDLRILFNRFATDTNIIAGHSYGGALAASLAIDHQDKVNRLVLISPVPCTPNLQISWAYKLPLFMMEIFRFLLEKKAQKQSFDPTTDPKIIETELYESRKNPMYVIKAAIDGMLQMQRIDVTMLTVPTLILLGQHDQLILSEVSQKFYQQLPHHRIIMLDNIAHMALAEKPDVVNIEMTNFLQEEFQFPLRDRAM